MSGTAVVFLPGLMGSQLFDHPLPGIYRPIWLDALAILGGATQRLDLAVDGVSPGPIADGAEIVPGGPLAEFYGLGLLALIEAGFDLWIQGYDWRLSVFTVAPVIWPAIKQWLGNRQLFIVAHSLGGLVARALYGEMLKTGQGGQLARIICLGSPHAGSWETYAALWRQPQLYWLMASLTGLILRTDPKPQVGVIDQVIASWPSFYELMPFESYGWLAAANPDQARVVYSPPFWAPAGNYWTSAFAAAAVANQALLQELTPASQMVNLCGTGFPTRYALSATGSFDQRPEYVYSSNGDGTVPNDSSFIQGAPMLLYPQAHFLLPQDVRVMSDAVAIVKLGSGSLAFSKEQAARLATQPLGR